MTQVGQIVTGAELGRSGNKTYRLAWLACPTCGKQRWVYLKKGKPEYDLCRSCANKIRSSGRKRENNNNWKGGQHYDEGYVVILRPEHPHTNAQGYIKRAILVLEQKLGRLLLLGMDSHHINGIKDDDRPENLMEIGHRKHGTLHGRPRLETTTGGLLAPPREGEQCQHLPMAR